LADDPRVDRRPVRRRLPIAARRSETSRRRRHDIDAYYLAEQDPDVYRSAPFDDNVPLSVTHGDA
jgi:hypothetical protein